MCPVPSRRLLRLLMYRRRWQGKADPAGAISAWEQLLKANPDYPQRQQVEQYIAKAIEHAARG